MGFQIPVETDHGNLMTKSILLQSDSVANNTLTIYLKKKILSKLTLHNK